MSNLFSVLCPLVPTIFSWKTSSLPPLIFYLESPLHLNHHPSPCLVFKKTFPENLRQTSLFYSLLLKHFVHASAEALQIISRKRSLSCPESYSKQFDQWLFFDIKHPPPPQKKDLNRLAWMHNFINNIGVSCISYIFSGYSFFNFSKFIGVSGID